MCGGCGCELRIRSHGCRQFSSSHGLQKYELKVVGTKWM